MVQLSSCPQFLCVRCVDVMPHFFVLMKFDEVEKQKMKDETASREHDRAKEIETVKQRHAEVVDEIDQVFVRSCSALNN